MHTLAVACALGGNGVGSPALSILDPVVENLAPPPPPPQVAGLNSLES